MISTPKIPAGPYRFIFKIRFKSLKDLNAYVRIWREGSQIIQDESLGAMGTKLHRVVDERFALLAIAEWHSREDRDYAFKLLGIKYSSGHVVHSAGAGEVQIIGRCFQIETVSPARTTA